MISKAAVAQMIDHTILKPEATPLEVAAVVAEGARLGTFSVCISPSQLPVKVPAGLAVACVVGFPSGAVKASVKAFEASQAAADGADEVDMVVNLSFVKTADWGAVEGEIRAVREAAPDVLLKVIIESAALTDNEIIACCEAAEHAGADFVKTSTGFHPSGGASVHAVALMRKTVGNRLGVKASGGIRTPESAAQMIQAGASRLGLSASAAILDGFSD